MGAMTLLEKGRMTRPLAAALLAVPLLSACQTGSGGGAQVVDAPGDNCAVHRAVFRSTEPTFESVATGVALSVAAGVAAGVLTSAITGSGRAGTTVGLAVAGTGIAATLISANFQSMQGQARRDALLSQTTAVGKFGERVTGANVAVEQLTTCRRDQVRMVQADVRARRMTADEGRARLATIRGWYDGDLTLIRGFDERLTADTRQLTDSTRHINSAALDAPPPAFRPYTGIVAQSVSAKQGADFNAADALPLQPGQTINVVGREGNWLRVQSGGRSGYVQAFNVAQQTAPAPHQGASAQTIRAAAKDDAAPLGDVATGSSYRVVGRMTGWLVVDNAGRRGFVRATALRPATVDESGNDVVQATASAVASRNAFASGAQTLEAESRRISLDA